MKKYLLVSVMAAAFLTACNNPSNNNNQQATESRTENRTATPRCAGIYKGTLPAASSSGILTTVTLYGDNTCTIHSEYIGEKDNTFDDKGSYRQEGDLVTVTLDNAATYYYRAEQGQLRMLNSDKQPVTGDLADHYILKQTQSFTK